MYMIICRGLIDVLTSSCPLAQRLLSRVVFKIIPMLNPDGVVNGHHRTNLAGLDLNRQWSRPTLERSPTVYHLRALLLAARRQGRGPVLFCDFHGHSRKRNVFMFGCAGPDDAAERLFPWLLSSRCADFSFEGCSFKVMRSKADAARVAVSRDAHLVNSFTIESSFAGPDQGPGKGTHLDTRRLEEVGHHFCGAVHDLVEIYSKIPRAAKAAHLQHCFPPSSTSIPKSASSQSVPAASSSSSTTSSNPSTSNHTLPPGVKSRFDRATALLRSRFPSKFTRLDDN